MHTSLQQLTTQYKQTGKGRKHHLVEVIDELSKILNGVDVVVRRLGDKGHSRLAAPQIGDVRAHLLRRQLSALTFTKLLNSAPLVSALAQMLALKCSSAGMT